MVNVISIILQAYENINYNLKAKLNAILFILPGVDHNVL